MRAVQRIRQIGREKILERLCKIQNNQYSAKDILSSILMNSSIMNLIFVLIQTHTFVIN